jgi:chromosome segregation ATPase
MTDADEIQQIMSSISMELGDFKPLSNPTPIHNQNDQINNSNSQIMEKEQEFAFGSVCAQLGLPKESEVPVVVNRITTLINSENQVQSIQASYNELKIQKEGLDAQLTNVQNELTTVKNELQAYKDAEKAQHDAAIEKFVDDAVAAGKIVADAKAKWVTMAQSNFEVVQETLNSIAPRDKISEKIATDAENIKDAESTLTDLEKKAIEAVNNAVGSDFKFGSFD